MASTTFVLKEPKGSTDSLIYLLFRFHNQSLKYSTGLKINPRYWNFENQKARETKLFTRALEYNTTLANLDNQVQLIYRRLINDNIIPTKDKLRIELQKSSRGHITTAKNDLIKFIEEQINSGTKQPNTLKNQKQALRILKDYESEKNLKLIFDSIDLDFYEKFVKYCLNKNYGTNTIGCFVKHIKAFMNIAFDKKLTSNIEFKSRKFRTLTEESDSIYLTLKEIDRIYRLNLKEGSRLDKVRDLFIIGCYSGLRYSDLIRIKNDNLIDNGTKLRLKTEKTGENVIIPLNSSIRAIVKKYKGIPSYSISNQKMNDYLKELGELAELNDKVLINRTKGGTAIESNSRKFELLTVHTARRSFATNAYLMQVPTISIMKITGHRTEKAFLKYIKISQEDNANKLITHPFFK